jgi:dephospho-CoA kinase
MIIGLTGMPGSGKSVVTRIANGLGINVVRMGDIIREEAKKRDEDTGIVAVKLREEYGNFIVAQRCLEKIKKLEKQKIARNKEQKGYMIEGMRSQFELELFRENFETFKVIAIYSSPKTRFKRLQRRKRSDDSNSKLEFNDRDNRELKFGIGNVMALADFMVVNEGPIWKFKNMMRRLLKNEVPSNG